MYIVNETYFNRAATADANAASLTKREYKGLSTETLPTLAEENAGSTVFCSDTGDFYTYLPDESNPTHPWVKLGTGRV